MKKFLKYLIIGIVLFPLMSLNAAKKVENNCTIEKYYVNSEIEIAGGLHIRELIELSGDCDKFERSIPTKNNSTIAFTGLESDLKGSDIYNPTSVSDLRIGLFNTDKKIDFNSLVEENIDENIDYFELKENNDNKESGIYTFEENDGDNLINIYNKETTSNIYLYLDYSVTNVLVEHNDAAEFYYTFLTKDFPYSIKSTIIFVSLPYAAKDVFKVWAHGDIDGEVQMDAEKRGVYATFNNFKVGSFFDIRTLFDKEYFQININQSKKSGLDAIAIIEKIENDRMKETKKISNLLLYGAYGINGITLIGLIIFIIYSVIMKKNKTKLSKKNKLQFTLFGVIGLIIGALSYLYYKEIYFLVLPCFSIIYLIAIIIMNNLKVKKRK